MVTLGWSLILKPKTTSGSFFALLSILFCLIALPEAQAHPGSLRGIDLPSVISLRDQARHMAHMQKADDQSERSRLERVRTIVIDPGHGGENSGARGIADIPEKHLTLELAYELREQLQEKYPDLRVVLTRYWDTTLDLTQRVHLANLASADLFISLHYNAAPHDRAIGFETYFLNPEEVTPGEEEVRGLPIASALPTSTGVEPPVDNTSLVGQFGDDIIFIQQDLLRAHQHTLSGLLAETVQSRLTRHIDSIDRGVKQANFGVLRGAHMPAILVEAGFLTHPQEGIQVISDDHRLAVTQALIEAVEAFDQELQKALDD